MRRAFLALVTLVLLGGCFAANRIEQGSRFGNLFGLAQQSRQSGDFSQALALFASARDAAATPQQRYLASLGQFDLAVQMDNQALATEAANAALNTGVTIDPVLLGTLQSWANAGAVVEITQALQPGPAPTPGPTPPVIGGGSITPAEDDADESITPNTDGSVPLRALKRQRDRLPPGVALFTVPPDMVEKDESDVTYRVQVSQAGTFRIVPEPGSVASAGGNHVYAVKVGHCMSAELTGAGFTIQAKQDAVQKTGGGSAVWRWSVTPSRAGPRKLTLTSRILAFVAGHCTEQLDLLPEQERTIDVKVAAAAPAPIPGPAPVEPKPEPKQGGMWGVVGLIGLVITALATLLAKVNGLFDELIKFRDRLLTLLGRKPKEAAAPPSPA